MLEDALCVSTNLGKHSLFVSSVKTGTRRIILLDELSSVVRCSGRSREDSSSRRIMRLAPVSTLGTNNQTNNECLPKFVQMHNASSSIKTAIRLWKSQFFHRRNLTWLFGIWCLFVLFWFFFQAVSCVEQI